MAEPVDFFSACHARIPAFTRRHFGLAGSLRLHLARAGPGPAALAVEPVPRRASLLPAPPRQLGALASAWRSLARWLATRRLFMETRLSRRIGEAVAGELLGLGEQIMHSRCRARAERTEALLSEYMAARHAVAELAAGMIALMVGFLVLHAMTPGALSLGPLLAQQYAEQSAVESFWAGAWAARSIMRGGRPRRAGRSPSS